MPDVLKTMLGWKLFIPPSNFNVCSRGFGSSILYICLGTFESSRVNFKNIENEYFAVPVNLLGVGRSAGADRVW